MNWQLHYENGMHKNKYNIHSFEYSILLFYLLLLLIRTEIINSELSCHTKGENNITNGHQEMSFPNIDHYSVYVVLNFTYLRFITYKFFLCCYCHNYGAIAIASYTSKQKQLKTNLIYLELYSHPKEGIISPIQVDKNKIYSDMQTNYGKCIYPTG